ncbi:hypothetical protein BS50DRAFT_629688 [Corynespora cassiicola Philippines]|uniref:Uncharacterized protein n=1 Tax=Corynespora cassiicola Philippines TaxID=1448308 RepID=A0A2T2P814_CORCC|nr:hypothetical protein BS50DRAFT_629688 [Corynespora cassiicola Philippines]
MRGIAASYFRKRSGQYNVSLNTDKAGASGLSPCSRPKVHKTDLAVSPDRASRQSTLPIPSGIPTLPSFLPNDVDSNSSASGPAALVPPEQPPANKAAPAHAAKPPPSTDDSVSGVTGLIKASLPPRTDGAHVVGWRCIWGVHGDFSAVMRMGRQAEVYYNAIA